MRRSISIVIFAVAVAAAASACGKKKGPAPPSPAFDNDRAAAGASRDDGGPGTATVTAVGKDADSAPAVGPIYFELDSTTLSDDARRSLERYGAWLATRDVHVIVEGHADERGTTEYNIALGQRRAQVIADFLRRLGVDAGRVDTISYGEERPVASGADEASWAQNRRGELRARD